MLVGIYSPYLDTLGGGERYILTIAELLASDHQVRIFLDTNLKKVNIQELKKNLEERLNLDLSRCEFIMAPFGKGSSFFERVKFLKEFNLLIAVTDGSIFYSTAKKSFLHIQSPIPFKAENFLWGKIKLSSWDGIIYNSEFTKKNAQTSWGLKGYVVYPPVDISKIKPLKKKKQILTVGRFFGYLKSKKHEVLIKTFKELEEHLEDWSLYLAGSASEGDKTYLEELRKLAGDSKIFFHQNLPFSELVKLYGESQIYWHAAGFEESDPTKQEHFGITTVEAMAGGAVPIVINKGGQKEIVEDGVSGYLWESLDELKKKTLELVTNERKRQTLSENAIRRSELYSKEKFGENMKKLFLE